MPTAYTNQLGKHKKLGKKKKKLVLGQVPIDTPLSIWS